MEFYHGITQAEVEAAFGGLSAQEAARLILGEQRLTEDQKEALHRASGCGYRIRFDPQPVGHLRFAPVGTRGTGNGGWHVLVPDSPECRAIVTARRVEKLAARIKSREAARKIVAYCRGYAPAVEMAAILWPIIKAHPKASDQTLRSVGFKPKHPIDAAAIAAVREALAR